MPDIEAIRARAERLGSLSWKEFRTNRHLKAGGRNTGIVGPSNKNLTWNKRFIGSIVEIQDDVAEIVNATPALLSLTDSLTAERDELRRIVDAVREEVGYWRERIDSIGPDITQEGDGYINCEVIERLWSIAQRREGE